MNAYANLPLYGKRDKYARATPFRFRDASRAGVAAAWKKRYKYRSLLFSHPRPVTLAKRGILNMLNSRTSPFARPSAGLRIKQGGPPLQRPDPAEVTTFPEKARGLIGDIWRSQAS